jgi:LysR family hydrogen peroxide-inducible transcriptional activator
MNIRDLRYIVAVADERHFGRAAERCHVSQPALSGQIRKLEDGLGVALFERTSRAVRITPVGARIVAQARQLIDIADGIVATAQAARDPFSGPFRLGMIATIGPYLSPLILPAIRRDLPDLSLTLVEGLTTELEDRVANGDLDGAILATAPVDPHLEEIVLYDEPFRVALPGGHPLAGRKQIDLDALDDDELLLLADGHCLRDQVVDACRTKSAAATANTRETSLETLLALVAAGDGVTLVPALTRLGDERPNDAVIIRPVGPGAAGRTVRLVGRTTFPRPPLMARLAAIIRSSVPISAVSILD